MNRPTAQGITLYRQGQFVQVWEQTSGDGDIALRELSNGATETFVESNEAPGIWLDEEGGLWYDQRIYRGDKEE